MRLSYLTKLLLVFALTGCSIFGHYSDGKVAEVAEAVDSGEVYFQLDPPAENRCGKDLPFVIDTALPEGQALLELLLNAYAVKSSIRVESSGDCSKTESEWVTRILQDN